MRIALETRKPLPQYKCWYAYDAKKNATVNDLRRAINKDLKLVQSSRDLELKGGSFAFLPQLPLKGLIQDDDIITIKFDKHNKKRVVKKTTVRAKVEKPKKSDKRSTMDKKSSNEKKRKAIDTEDDKPKKKRKEKETTSPSKPETTTTAAAAASNDGLTKTQKRNRRKAIKRIKQREEQEKLKQQQQQQTKQKNVIETTHDEDKTASSEHLLKFNKNKRKDFLKVQNKKKREHVRFDGIQEEEEEEEEEEWEAPDEITATTYDDQYDAYGYEMEDHENLYGAAYVTSVEADQRYKGEKKEGKSYPIDHMADHFYAEAPPSSEDVEEDEIEITQEEQQQQQPIQRNYEELPKLGFSGSSIPAVGDLIAFKLLSMTEAYTPEISDWKEAKVLSLDTDGQPSITVEYQPGFLLKKHHGKFDLPDEEEDEDEEGDEENEFAKDQTMTYTDSDIVDMRKVVEE